MKNISSIGKRLSYTLGLLIIILTAFQNCGKVDFSATPVVAASASPKGAQCILQNTTQNLKILFMVDNSGSTDSTDPNKKYRQDVLQKFISDYSGKSNFNYSISYFSANTSTYDKTSSNFASTARTPWGQIGDLSNALNEFLNTGTSSHTAYDNAFTTIKSTIQNDLNSAGWKYVVLFMSDGQPTDLTSDPDGTQQSAIAALVNNVLTLRSSDQLTISSIFFGSATDTKEIQNLTKMAAVGGGDFINTNVTQSISIDDIVAIPGLGCQ